jgi:hypothetical protein
MIQQATVAAAAASLMAPVATPAPRHRISSIIFVRHFDDIDDLSVPLRDNPLSHRGIVEGTELSLEIAQSLPRGPKQMIGSARKRGLMSVALIARALGDLGDPIATCFDRRITDSYKGCFALPENYRPGDEFVPLKKAGEVYKREAYELGNFNYRFGDPVNSAQGVGYPEIAGWFSSYGANHWHNSMRVFSFLNELLGKSTDVDAQWIVVTHSHVIRRFLALRYALVKHEPGDPHEVLEAELPFMRDPALKKEIRSTGSVLEFDLSPLHLHARLISQTVRHLTEQHRVAY